ncbi:alpha/beta hydrolase [Sphingobium sp. HBC34]|uniref:Alpha/beta hydrolase n=1 Tax=Sphingobium cyanobacteriorum TaxID=3063954 RepID=A0ABT8ZPD2_9SPHN|nr:alpha/beta hydrolase [Sphingobium sp. HBC34]MDO7836387.1 alpha/beta hydrolase [Sphingobium sp. HBC34]
MNVKLGDRNLGWGQLPRLLEGYGGARPPAPPWFIRAQDMPFERLTFAVDGCEIELICWGDRGKPGILLLHGSMAHAQWWSAVAPLLAKDYRVCAMSFAGMGGSGHRAAYSVAQMAREGRAALEAGGLFDAVLPPILACHSFGGKAGCLIAGNEGGERLLGVMFVDSFVVPDVGIGNAPPYRSRFYQSEADAIARFRLSPDQPGAEPYVLDAVARAAIRQMPDGRWTWCFDPDFFAKLDYANGWDELLQARCRLAFLRGELSDIISAQDEALQRRALRPDTMFVEIPNAYHHVMIDQPLALVAAMRTVAEAWAKEREP